jgi:ABC-2 type transport system ATP-binding protein
MNEVMVEARNLRKSYGSTQAVRDISFEARRGEVFALLGPNGSGKTSTLECLEGIRQPDSGRLSIAGLDPARHARALRAVVGVQLQSSSLPASMTVEEAMRFFCAYHGRSPRFDLVERLGLGEKRRSQFGTLSVGQQRRLALVLAVTHEPEVVFLDEPTAGLDVQSRAELHALIGELRAGGATVVLATHDMAEAEKLADRAAILLRGRVAAEGSPRQLTASGNRRTKISVSTEQGLLLAHAPDFPGASPQGPSEDYSIFISEDPGRSVASILAWIDGAGDRLVDLRVERPSLEERFLEIAGTPTEGGRA